MNGALESGQRAGMEVLSALPAKTAARLRRPSLVRLA
jgi:hypothetical protein